MNEEAMTGFLRADGFDDACIGYSCDFGEPRLVYSVKRCLLILEVDMESEEALEYFNFNVSGAFVGDQTPIWCWDLE